MLVPVPPVVVAFGVGVIPLLLLGPVVFDTLFVSGIGFMFAPLFVFETGLCLIHSCCSFRSLHLIQILFLFDSCCSLRFLPSCSGETLRLGQLGILCQRILFQATERPRGKHRPNSGSEGGKILVGEEYSEL
ncbi:hypothetical protein BZA77DRAFT_59074 [Pyronema omphalodes]|nr:hypothetical protein BZA77DRAFT_59074 [Pyronema omphalodes]